MTFGLSGAALGGIVAGAGAIGGALIGSSASKSAANTQAAASDRSAQVSKDIFDTQVSLQEPWRQAGMAGIGRLNSLLGLSPQAAPPAAGGTPVLRQGPDGVFAPHAEIPQPGQLPQPVTQENFNAQAYLAANPDVAQFIQAHPGSATPWEHYNQHGRDEGRSLGLPTPQAPQQAPQAPQAPPAFNEQAYLAANPDVAAAVARGEITAQEHYQNFGQREGRSLGTPGNDMTGFGSLNQPFGAADFAADAAPKIGPFVAPNAIPTFNPATALQEDPGYQFRATQGEKALQRAATVNGGVGSGKYIKDAITFNQGQAAQEYGNAFNRFQVTRTNAVNDNKDALGVYSVNRANSLQDYSSANDRFQQSRLNVLNPLLAVSGFGQQAATTTGAAAQNYGNQAAAAIQSAGNARAAGQVGSANAFTGAIGQGISMYQQNQLLSRFPQYGTSFYDTGAGMSPPNPFYGG